MADSTVSGDAQWQKLKKLIEKQREISDKLILEAVGKEIDATVAILKDGVIPVPQWALTEPELMARFGGGSAVAAKETTQPAPDLNRPGPDASFQDDDFALDSDLQANAMESSPEAIAEAENLLRQAKVLQMRGARTDANDLLKRAMEIAPGASAVLEAIGDAYADQKKFAQARRAYKAAIDADSANVSADKKHAHLVFSTDVAMKNFGTASETEVVANARAATLLNFACPGVGQIVLGETVKGVVFLVVVIGCWIAAALMGLPKAIVSLLGNSPQGDLNPVAFVLAFVAIVVHIVAIADSKGKAKTMEFHKRTVARPQPPADLPFE